MVTLKPAVTCSILVFIFLLGCSPQKKNYEREDVNLKFRSHDQDSGTEKKREKVPEKEEKKSGGKEFVDYDFHWISPLNIDYRKYEKNSPLEILLQNGHTDNIIDAAVSPDGRFIISSSDDRTIKIWTMDGTLVKTVPVHGKFIYSIAFLPDGSGFAASLSDGERMSSSLEKKSVRVWDMNGRLMKTYEGKNYNIARMSFSSDGKNIATTFGYGAKTFDIRDMDFNIIRTVATPHRGIKSLVFSPDGRYIATGGAYYTTKDGFKASAVLWGRNGEFIRDLNTVKPHAIGADKGDGGGRKSRKDRKDLKEKKNIMTTDDLEWVSFSPDGKHIILIDRLYADLRTIGGETKLLFKTDFPHRAFFTPDSRLILISGAHDTRIFAMDGRELGTKPISPRRSEPAIKAPALAMTPDGRYIISDISGKKAGNVSIWDLNGTKVREMGTSSIEFRRVLFSPDSGRLILERPDARQNLEDGTFIWHIGNNQIDRINERIGFTSSGEEYRFYYEILVREVTKDEKRKQRLIEKGKKTTQSNRGHTFIVKNNKGEWKFKTGYGVGLIPLSDGTVARWEGNSVTFFDLAGNPLKRISVRGGESGGIGGIDDYGTVFSPDMKYLAIETDTTHGGIHGLGLVDMDGKQFARHLFDSELSTAAMSQSGALIATGHKNGDIQVLTREGKILKKLKGHLVDINGIAFDYSGKFLVSTSKDRTVRIWNLATGDYVTLVVYESGEWVVFNEKGFFDCSDGGRRYVKFIKGVTAYDFQQFWGEYFVPGFIAGILKNRKIETADLSGKIDKTPLVTLRHSLDGGRSTDDPAVTATVCAVSRGSGVGSIFLMHNGRSIDELSRGLAVSAKGDCRTFPIELLPGENTLTGAAYDRENAAYGRSDDVLLQYRPRTAVKPDMHILAVGISEYRDRNIRLLSPSDDAVALASALKTTGSTLYGKVYASVLTNDRATRENIIKSMEELAQKVKKSDTVILFFAGHGDLDGGFYYFLGHDADITALKKTGISIDDISAFIRSVRANKIAVFFDTCKSGGAAESLSRLALERGYDDVRIMANLARERGIAVFSAASKSQAAFEIKSLGHGIFTYSLLHALNNRRDDIADNGLISIARLLSFVNRMTRDTAQKHLKTDQSPILYIFGDDFSIGREK